MTMISIDKEILEDLVNHKVHKRGKIKEKNE
jgi:hypothetical protein